ncbi:sensor histidine kinase, partial [Vallitalea sediminicola]
NKEIINELKDVKREIKIQGLSFIIFVKEVYSIRETQYLIIFRDITTYRRVESKIKCSQKDLNNSNKELKKAISTLKETSKIGARNYVARELHDIIGHSLVVAIKLLEVAKLYYKKDKNQSIVALYDASSSIGAGIENMNTISLKERMDGIYTGELLKKDLRKLFERIKNAEIKTNLHFKGVYYKIDEKVFDIIKKVCTELITNSLKHSGGTEIFISVNIKRESINILVIDNGNGCDNLTKGNGLNGIEERLKLIDGDVDFISSKHEGFMSKISINT